MATTEELLPAGSKVTHRLHGQGRVVADVGPTVVARFGPKIESVLRDELQIAPSLETALQRGQFDDSRDTLLRAQALAIRSVNDQWGVFSRSRVQLLPHQLWVCHRVNRNWPFRWLVADDVGLGKTIECGLVLMPLIASGIIRRLLILAPAKLVPQWQKRLCDMFDIRLQTYAKEVDTERLDFWGTANMVVASFHTLRADNRGARSRLLKADPWDCVVVDEAHHLSADERMGETLAYSLLRELEEQRKINSLLFFTGTPHRGKDYGFFALMRLIRPDLFEADGDAEEQMQHLAEAMIRNNKAATTDLQGNRLFTDVTVTSEEYQFSDAEEHFYRTLSSFIVEGRAYAATFDGRAQTARMLVLITLQKLAASSIAAIRSALQKRRDRLALVADEARGLTTQSTDAEVDDLDEAAERDEATPAEVLAALMDDEVSRLDELLQLASPIKRENKIVRLVDLIESKLPPNEPVLLFTEYKATQAMVVNELQARFGHGTAAFINGDERLEGLLDAHGNFISKSWSRDDAADAFNAGDVRFLVSTEAAGEGIDLQERCSTLIHVDMPWNPMRLHQRVGRLSRYGQKNPVSVFILRNPDTVEARIWDLLNAKLERIQAALSQVMEDREDISQLVIGMAGNGFFNGLFAEAQAIGPAERLENWFDRQAATLGGEDIVERVKGMLGNVAKFDFQQVGNNLPKVDLPDLERFFSGVIARHGRRIFNREDGLEVKTPEEWAREDYAIRDRYERLAFDRTLRGRSAETRVVGIGHALFDKALTEAERFECVLAACARLDRPLLVVAIEDEVTGQGASVSRVVVGVSRGESGPQVLHDWELLQLLNSLGMSDRNRANADPSFASDVDLMLDELRPTLDAYAPYMDRPRAWPQILLVPEQAPT